MRLRVRQRATIVPVLRPFRPFIAGILLCIQCMMCTMQGQTLLLERRMGSATCAIEAFDEVEDFARGPHRHDQIPLHVHVPDDDALRGRQVLPAHDGPGEPMPVGPPCLLVGPSSFSREVRLHRPSAPVDRRADARAATVASLRVIRMLV